MELVPERVAGFNRLKQPRAARTNVLHRSDDRYTRGRTERTRTRELVPERVEQAKSTARRSALLARRESSALAPHHAAAHPRGDESALPGQPERGTGPA